MAIINHSKKDDVSVEVTERSVQKVLFKNFVHGKENHIGVPNTFVFGWEADFVSTTKAGYSHEYEIKLTRQDLMKELNAIQPSRDSHENLTKKHKHNVISQLLDRKKYDMPNYFWFVTFDGICRTEELPGYAGHIEVKQRGGELKAYIIRKAEKLHKDKLCFNSVVRLASSASYQIYSREII